ncbi:MAG: DUF2156 domain-containing protein [Candidatus Margulisbacteria bacterium]|nr:DUF2156 domain-containing protein [Candidatus Margulisiibacteriota bacterium]MBU1022355.1 DUF2156 domain-containing protein [Candidatus Margulisiibacteriota bacterium]MBU1729093.1 DUF2156 domain-containing protein [Candidatus Margulisiibacteriota bacterium]MBU1954486.1 DUF2156 domain-containing protein [Candidatus Margulisiibacteriota bacterium]
MIPEYPKFKNLEIADFEIVTKYLNASPRSICELNLANLFIYRNFDRAQLTMINENLCLLISPMHEAPYFLEPLSQHKLSSTIETCLNLTGKLSRLSKRFCESLSKDEYRCKYLRNQSDYIYLREDLANLEGKKFDGKRNHLKRFLKHFPDYQFVPLKAEHAVQALKLFEEWAGHKKETRFFTKFSYNSQKKAIEEAFGQFDKLNCKGGMLFAEDSVKGFILGTANPNMISVHFSYGKPQTAGVFQMLIKEACEKTFNSFKYINLEQDLGIPGLRKAKLSWHPKKLEEKFEIKPLH